MAKYIRAPYGRKQDLVKTPLLEISIQVCGLNQKALVMKKWDQFHQSGKEFAKMILMQLFSATGASVFGYGNGTAKGGSPRARVAAYKVCWPPVGGNECFDADILAAFDAAIHDGVDVLSVSLGGDAVPFFNDSVAIGSFHAVKRGIVVVCSAGNSGPGPGTVSNMAPWQITVGASTIDRQFPSYVVLGKTMSFQGESLSIEALPKRKFFPVVAATSAKTTNASVEEA